MPPKANTVTQLKARVKLFLLPLENAAMMILEAMRVCFGAEHGWPGLPNPRLEVVRNAVSRASKDDAMYMLFFQQMNKRVPHLANIVERNVHAQIDFLKLEDCVAKNELGVYVTEPIQKLWFFMLRLVFEAPALVMEQEDDALGSLVIKIRERMKTFVAECIPDPSPECVFSEATLAEHNLQAKKT
jgi:hypothetical protein